MRYLLDTNIWIAYLRKNRRVRTRLVETLTQRHEICIIPVVYYEFLRGLEKLQDPTTLDEMKRFWSTLSYYEGTKAIWDEAIRWWVITTQQNTMPGNRDILIAAFALQLNATIVTRNVRHFLMFPLTVDNWIDD